MKTGVTHPPTGDGACLDCHAPHRSLEPSLLTAAVPGQCLDCHDGDGPDFRARHLGLAGTELDCRKCHDPHASAGSGLIQRVVHDPFGGGACDVCHPGAAPEAGDR
jgi:predicted CXXCH cytochrome family protein